MDFEDILEEVGSYGKFQKRLTIFYTAEVHGTLEPCGCTSDPLGDIARMTAAVRRAQKDHGVLVVENNVLVMENANKPGTLAGIALALAKAKVNIEYAYLATSPKAKSGMAVMRVSDTKKALKVLGKLA